MVEDDTRIYATLVWYYNICRRQVWLIANRMEPDQEHTDILIGRVIGQESYGRETKEVELDGLKFDVVKKKGDKLIVGEIKKSSRFIDSSRMQLAFYLYKLRQLGIDAEGELLFPKEKKRVPVVLDDETVERLENSLIEISRILDSSMPPPAQRSRYCNKCGYVEFCWGEE